MSQARDSASGKNAPTRREHARPKTPPASAVLSKGRNRELRWEEIEIPPPAALPPSKLRNIQRVAVSPPPPPCEIFTEPSASAKASATKTTSPTVLAAQSPTEKARSGIRIKPRQSNQALVVARPTEKEAAYYRELSEESQTFSVVEEDGGGLRIAPLPSASPPSLEYFADLKAMLGNMREAQRRFGETERNRFPIAVYMAPETAKDDRKLISALNGEIAFPLNGVAFYVTEGVVASLLARPPSDFLFGSSDGTRESLGVMKVTPEGGKVKIALRVDMYRDYAARKKPDSEILPRAYRITSAGFATLARAKHGSTIEIFGYRRGREAAYSGFQWKRVV